ncbi:MAG: flagellar biosynthetic protein FliO [Bauldia sp.]
MIQQTLEPILGATGAVIVQFLAVLILVLVLMALVVGLVRFVAGGSFASGLKRQRAPRLGLVDTLPVDQRRRLILVRRDQFEHLLLIGGPTDVVVEQTIFRGVPLNARLRPEPVRMPGAQPTAAALPGANGPHHPAAENHAAASRDGQHHPPTPTGEREDWPLPAGDRQAHRDSAIASAGRRHAGPPPGMDGAPPLAPLSAAEAVPRQALAKADGEVSSIVMAAEASIARLSETAPAASDNETAGRTSPERVASLEREMARLLGEIGGKKP